MVRLYSLAAAAGLLSCTFALSASEIPSDLPVSSLLASAQTHLSRGQTSDALLYYDAAIARDPSNYLTFFKRATTYLSLGRTSQATEDFNRVLSLKPGFEGAHTQLGRLKARSGEWDAAKEQYLLAHKKPGSKDFEELVEAEGSATLAESAAKAGNWEDCVNHADVAIQLASRSLALRELRSKCRFESGQIAGGIADLMHVLQMKPGDTTPHVRISATHFYALDERQEGMAQIRKCLMSDPDSKMCRKLLKEEKAVDKIIKKVNEALERKQPITAAKQLAGSKAEEGLIKQVKDQVEKLRADGMIPQAAGNTLVSHLVSMACQAYYTVRSFAPPFPPLHTLTHYPDEETSPRKALLHRIPRPRSQRRLRPSSHRPRPIRFRELRRSNRNPQQSQGIHPPLRIRPTGSPKAHQHPLARSPRGPQTLQTKGLLQSPRHRPRRRPPADQIRLPQALEAPPPRQGSQAEHHQGGFREEDGVYQRSLRSPLQP